MRIISLTSRRVFLSLLATAILLLPIPLELIAERADHANFLALRQRGGTVEDYEELLGDPLDSFVQDGKSCREFLLDLFSRVTVCSAAPNAAATVAVESSDYEMSVKNAWKIIKEIYRNFGRRHFG